MLTNSLTVSSLEVSNVGGELVVDSRLIAQQLEIQHKNVLATIDKYFTEFEEFGHLAFETRTVTNSAGARNQVVYALLNEDQSTYLMSLSRNTDIVRQCKRDLVKAFSKAKQIIKVVIPAQNDRLRELELELEILKVKERSVLTANTMVSLHGAELGLTIAGLNVGQIIELQVATTEVLNPTTGATDEFLSATQLADEVKRRTGQKIKNAEFIRKLKEANRDDLILPVTRNATCEYVTCNRLDEAIRVVFGNSKQQLLQVI